LLNICNIKVKLAGFRIMLALSRKYLPFAIVLLLVAHQAKAENHSTEQSYYDATEVTLGGDNNVFVASEGVLIRISAGQSVRLLPGTHLVAGAQVVIEAGYQAAKAEDTKEYKSVIKNPELFLSEFNLTANISFNPVPGGHSVISNSWGLAALVGSTHWSYSNNAAKIKNTGSLGIQCIRTAIGKHIFIPNLSWGSRPENIKVLRT